MPSAPSESLSVGGRVGIVAFPVAFVVLCFATSNLVLAFYAMVTIGLIVASVLGTVPRPRPRDLRLRPIGATVARQIPVLKVTRSNRVSVTAEAA